MGVMSPLYTVFKPHEIDESYLEWFLRAATGIYGIKADFSKIKEAVEIAGEKKAQKAKEN